LKATGGTFNLFYITDDAISQLSPWCTDVFS